MKLKNYNEFITESNKWIYEGDFTVTENMVKDGRFIEGKIPFKVNGNFSCSNMWLTTLKGSPVEIKEGFSFHCVNNKLTSLEGCPSKLQVN